MEENGEAPKSVEEQAIPEQRPGFTPITSREVQAPIAPESGFLSRLLSKIGKVKQPEQPNEIPQPIVAPTGTAIETDTLSAFSTQRTPEELNKLAQARNALQTEAQAQNAPAQPVAEVPISP
ncbi:MAG TPA: hypothetical protein PLD54_04040, partial [Candidatus Levybacteria bacterium]|nr:hypothetical protein [Candidatus Levybacteria bacterium]